MKDYIVSSFNYFYFSLRQKELNAKQTDFSSRQKETGVQLSTPVSFD
jgi:hypothetical protein